jgi:hypothetical protein
MVQIPFSIALQGLPGLVPIQLVLVPKVGQVQLVLQVVQGHRHFATGTGTKQFGRCTGTLPLTQVEVAVVQVAQMELAVPVEPEIQTTPQMV